MIKSNKILTGWIAFLFVVGHSTAIFVFAFPSEYLPVTLKNASSWYVHPLLDQTWSLFAPCPLHDSKMEVRYFFENDSTDWIQPLQHASDQHAKFRFTYHGDLVLGESNLLYYIANDLWSMGLSPYEDFPADSSHLFYQTASYGMLRNYVYGSSDYVFDEYPLKALVRCTFFNVQTGESGIVNLPSLSYKND